VVIFITGFADISLEEAYEKGVDAVFSKPFDRMLLLEAVTRAAQPLDAKFQRGSGRVDVELPIGIHFSGSAQTIDCVARNIGRGGMFVPLSESLPKLESCTFSIKAEQLGNIKIKGEGIVRWTRSSSPSSSLPVGAGIEFLSFEPESKRAVIDLINFLKTKSFIPRK
jgi:hypothetical protein